MRAKKLVVGIFVAGMLAGCGNGGTSDGPDMAVAASGADMAGTANGCPSLVVPVTTPDGGAQGDTFASYARGFFTQYCTRCHSSTLTDTMARSGAPEGLDWDQEAVVRMYLPSIRDAVGVANYMPPSAPTPSCAERRRLTRWIDADAP